MIVPRPLSVKSKSGASCSGYEIVDYSLKNPVWMTIQLKNFSIFPSGDERPVCISNGKISSYDKKFIVFVLRIKIIQTLDPFKILNLCRFRNVYCLVLPSNVVYS